MGDLRTSQTVEAYMLFWTKEREAGVWDSQETSATHREMRRRKRGKHALSTPPRHSGTRRGVYKQPCRSSESASRSSH